MGDKKASSRDCRLHCSAVSDVGVDPSIPHAPDRPAGKKIARKAITEIEQPSQVKLSQVLRMAGQVE